MSSYESIERIDTIMKFRIVMIFMLLLSCEVERSERIVEVNQVEDSVREIDLMLIVNNYRQSRDLEKLERLEIIKSACLDHIEYMIENKTPSHDYFFARKDFLINQGAETVEEIVAYGYSTNLSSLRGWLDSKSHRESIERENLTHFNSVIRADESGKSYYMIIFIKKEVSNYP